MLSQDFVQWYVLFFAVDGGVPIGILWKSGAAIGIQ